MPSRAEAWEEEDWLYPEEDDTPVDSIFAGKQQRLLAESLETCWPGPGKGRPFEVMANVGLFYSPRERPLVPDVMLSLDVRHPADIRSKGHRAYFIRAYGKPPEITIEIVSSTKDHEAGGKMRDYARAGVRYYATFDPVQCLSKQILRLYELHGADYIETAQQLFPEIGLGLTVWNGIYSKIECTWLRWCDCSGKLILTGAESIALKTQRVEREKQRADQETQRAEQETQRAEQEKQRAEQEKQRAEQEKQRQQMEREKQRAEQEKQRAEQEKREKQRAEQSVARLKEKLRELGIDPEEI
ncbi:MAG: Uma2 family endonuclease [Gammaproteobacteria bacterium]|nr:Uma2 family endonuclease [Gammaproteobacteria bacterium]